MDTMSVDDGGACILVHLGCDRGSGLELRYVLRQQSKERCDQR